MDYEDCPQGHWSSADIVFSFHFLFQGHFGQLVYLDSAIVFPFHSLNSFPFFGSLTSILYSNYAHCAPSPVQKESFFSIVNAFQHFIPEIMHKDLLEEFQSKYAIWSTLYCRKLTNLV